jgi:hypothetical protein
VVRRAAIVVCAALTAALVVAASASAAAPNYILVSGHGLARPVLLADWSENGELLSAAASAPRAKGVAMRGLSRRPRFDLAEFWNWSYLPRPTNPSKASQHGTFYPAHRGRPALIVITVEGTKVPRVVPAKVLQIFRAHGIPTRF